MPGLLQVVHPFGHGGDVQLARHLQDGFHHAAAPAGVVGPHKEAAIQLDGVHVQLVEHPQRGIPGTEIIQRAAESGLVHPVDQLAHPVRVIQQDGLGQFKLDKAPVHPVPVPDTAAAFQKIRDLQILPGQIHRDGTQFPALILPACQQAADLFKDKLIQPGNHPVLFKHRYKHRGRQHPLGGMLPADQRLCPGYAPVFQAHLGLEIHPEVPGLQRCVQPVDQFLFLQLGTLPFRIVKGTAALRRRAGLAGGAAAFLHGGHVVFLRAGHIRAETQFQVVRVFPALVKGVHLPVHLPQAAFDLLPVLAFQQHIKQVGGRAGKQFAGMQAALHGAVQVLQGPVALLRAEDIVDQFESLHIRRYQGIVAAFFEQAGCLAAETGIAHTTGDGVHKGHVFQAGLIPAAQQDHRKQHTAEDGDNQHGKPQVALHQERNILAEQIRRDHGKHIPVIDGQRHIGHHDRILPAAHRHHAGIAREHIRFHLGKLTFVLFRAVFPYFPQGAGHFVGLPGGQQFTVPRHHPGGALAVEALAGEHAGKQAAALDAQQHRVVAGFAGGIVDAQLRLPGHDQPGLAGLDHILPGQ